MAPVTFSPRSATPIGVRVTFESDGGRTVVWLSGNHDASTVESLTETMARSIALDNSDLVLDLSEVDFMGVATLEVITRAGEFLSERSRNLVIRSPSSCSQRIFDLHGLSALISTATTCSSGAASRESLNGRWVPLVDQAHGSYLDITVPDRIPESVFAGSNSGARGETSIAAAHPAGMDIADMAKRGTP